MATYWENSCSFGLRYVSWYKCLIVGLFFSHLGFWSGNLFLIAPFPDLCLLVPLNVFKYIQAISKLRMSSHRLATESGRWTQQNRTPINERICTHCRILEEEYHFVLECNIFIDLRKNIFPNIFGKGHLCLNLLNY